MSQPPTKKTIGFIELPDEALDLFGYYAQRPEWEVSVVVSIDAETYAARMANLLKIPLLDRPNRPALVTCDRLVVGKKPGLKTMVLELLEGTPIEVVAVEDALREVRLHAARGVRPEQAPEPAPGSPPAPKPAARPARKPAAASPTPPPAASARSAAPARPGTPPRPASKPPAVRSAPGPRSAAPERPATTARSGRGSSPSFDAGVLLGADFRNKLQALPLNDGDRLLREILELAVKTTRADSGSIMLVDETGSHLRIAVANGLPKWVVAHTRQEVGTGIAGTVFRTGEPRLVHGLVSGPGATSAEVRPGLRDAASVPIPGKEGPLGVLNLNVETEGIPFDESTLSILKLFAREASSAILRAISLKRLSGTVQREAAMRQVERLMSLQDPLASRLGAVADVLGQSLSADFAHCLLADADGNHLELLGPAKGQSVLNPRKQPVERGFAGWALRQGNPSVLEAGSPEDRAAMAYLPLVGSRPYGVLVFERIPLQGTTAVHVLQFLTEAKEIVEALLALEEATDDIDADFPPGRASA